MRGIVRFVVETKCFGNLSLFLQPLGILKIRILQMHSIQSFGDLQRLLETTTSLQQSIQQIISSAFLIQPFRIRNHIQLDGKHSHLSLILQRIVLHGLSYGPHRNSTTQMAQTHLGHIESSRFHAHLRQILPHTIRLN